MPPTPEEQIVDLYKEKKADIEHWFEDVRKELEWWMAYQPQKRIHSVRARMKDEHHLKDKITRKNLERASEPDPKKRKPLITTQNFFEEVIDLAGARVLVLYRHDLAIVDHFIYQCDKWHVLSAEAKVDKYRRTDVDWFKELGFSETNKRRWLIPEDDGYASVHYVLVPTTIPPCGNYEQHFEKCELQVRTIHEESWGEFSHEYNYPKPWADRLAKKLILRLSSLLHLAEDLVGDIRQFPADASIFREIHERSRTAARTSAHFPLKTITDMLAKFPYMTRSAPLAAIGLLTDYGSTAVGTIDANEIVTTGFGPPSFVLPEKLPLEPLTRLYLDAQSSWASKKNRMISKFYIQTPSVRDLASPHCQALPPANLKYYFVPLSVFDCFQSALEKRGLCQRSGYGLRDTQLFLWKSRSGPSNPVKLPGNDQPMYGFYSPVRDPDLLSGVIWCAAKDSKMFNCLQCYAQLLLRLAKKSGLLIPIPVRRATAIPEKLTKVQKRYILKCVEDCFDNGGKQANDTTIAAH